VAISVEAMSMVVAAHHAVCLFQFGDLPGRGVRVEALVAEEPGLTLIEDLDQSPPDRGSFTSRLLAQQQDVLRRIAARLGEVALFDRAEVRDHTDDGTVDRVVLGWRQRHEDGVEVAR